MITLRTAVNNIVAQSYWSAKRAGILKLKLEGLLDKGNKPVLVYQMGKVGSTSITEALREAGYRRVYQLHFLNPSNMAESEAVYRTLFPRLKRLDRHLINSFYVRGLIEKPTVGERWKILTLIREPMARNVSAFFQNMDLEFDPEERVINRAGGREWSGQLDDLIDLFLEDFQHQSTSRWFDDEIKYVFGVDVLGEPFDMERGFKIYDGRNADVLLIKYERLNEVMADALTEFLGITNVSLGSQNKAEDKYYSAQYRAFLESGNLPQWYLDKLYGSRTIRHFYSEEEILQFRHRWSGCRRTESRVETR